MKTIGIILLLFLFSCEEDKVEHKLCVGGLSVIDGAVYEVACMTSEEFTHIKNVVATKGDVVEWEVKKVNNCSECK